MSIIASMIHNVTDVKIDRVLHRINDNNKYELTTITIYDKDGESIELSLFNDKVSSQAIQISIDDRRNEGFK